METENNRYTFEDINSESFEGNSIVENNDEKEFFGVHPMLPSRKYNWAKRAELRKFEQALLKGVQLDI